MSVGTAPAPKRGRARRRWLRWGVAAIAVVVVGLLVLPKVTPSRWLAGVVAGQVGGGTGREIRIAEAEWGWAKGIVLEGVKVPAGGGEGRGGAQPGLAGVSLKRVAVRANLWDVLVGGTIPEVQLSDVTVDLDLSGPAAGEEATGPGGAREGESVGGRRDGADTAAGRGQPEGDAFPAAVGRIVVDGCRVNLHGPAGQAAEVAVPRAVIEMDRGTGVVKWQVALQVGEEGTIQSEGQFVLPRLASRQADLRGSLEMAWAGLALETLPASVLRQWGLAGIDGKVSGSLRAEMGRDWTLTFDAAGSTEGLRVRQAQGAAVQVPGVAARVAGRWQMIEQRVRLGTVWADGPGIEVRAAEPALVYDGLTNQIVQSNLSVRIADAQAMREAVERLGVAVPADLVLRGNGRIEVHVGREESATVAWLSADGAGLAGRVGEYYEHKAGEPLAMNVSCRLWDDGSLELQNARLDVPGGHVRLLGSLARQAGSEAGQPVVLKGSRVRVEWDDFERFASQSPGLAAVLRPIVRMSGAGSAEVTAETGPEGLRAGVLAEWLAGSRVVVGDWLDKPAGQGLRVEAAGRVGARYDWAVLDEVRVAAEGGTADKVTMWQGDKVTAGEDENGEDDKVTAWGSDGGVGDGVVLELRDLGLTARAGGQSGASVVGLDARGTVVALDVTALQELSPRMAEVLAPAQAQGRLTGSVNATCSVEAGGGSPRISGLQAGGELGLDGLGLAVEGVIRKQVGERLRLAGSASCRWDEDGKGQGFGGGRIELPGLVGQAWYEKGPDGDGVEQWAWGWVDVQDVERAAGMLPAVAELVRQESVGGSAAGRWEWLRRREAFDLNCSLDLTGVRCRSEMLRIHKRSGVETRVEAAITGPAGGAAGENTRLWRVPKMELMLGRSRASVVDAQVEMTDAWAKLLGGQGREAVHLIEFAWPIRRASGRLVGKTVFGEELASVSEDLGALLAKYGAKGQVGWTLEWRYGLGEGTAFAAQADAAELSLCAGGLDKATGVPLRARVEGKVALGRDAADRLTLAVDVTGAQGEAAGLTWSGQGRAEIGREAGQWRPRDMTVSGRFDARQIEQAAGLVEAAKVWQARGHVAGEGSAVFAEGKGWEIADLDVGMWPIEWSVLGVPCRAQGLVNVRGQTVEGTGLEAAIGRTQGRVTFEGTLRDRALDGQVGLSLANLDVEELVQVGGRVAESGIGQAETGGDTAEDSGSAGDARPAVDWGRSRLRFVGSADCVKAPIEAGQPAATLNALAWWGSVDRGALTVDLAGAFQGGALTGDVRGHMVDKQVPLVIHYRADRADATDLTRRMVVKGFPGMTVDGAVTLDETLTINMAGNEPAIPSAGELIVEGGVVRGAAAPKWVTRVFPGLQLASFRFNRMHNWYERDASGKTVNRIIFRGSPWSMYMNGWSQADGQMRYEIGVDLIGPAESEYWATADRGRLPLFIKTGRVVDGQLRNEVVSFLGPQQIGERLLKDNLLTITYHAVRQQVLRGKSASGGKGADRSATRGNRD